MCWAKLRDAFPAAASPTSETEHLCGLTWGLFTGLVFFFGFSGFMEALWVYLWLHMSLYEEGNN